MTTDSVKVCVWSCVVLLCNILLCHGWPSISALISISKLSIENVAESGGLAGGYYESWPLAQLMARNESL